MSSLRIFLVVAAIGSTMASPAVAAVTTYTSQAAFDAAVGSVTTFGFNEGGSTDNFHFEANPYTQSGISFTSSITAADIPTGGQGAMILIGAAATPNYGIDFLSFQNTEVGISGDITLAGLTAFGFQYGTYVLDGLVTVTVNGGAPYALSVTHTPSFIGFTSTTPITDLNIFFPGGYSFDLTSVSFGRALPSAAPEPATWAMMLGGFGLIGAALRRRRAVSVGFA